jgi:hypothetical protein
VVSIEPWRWVSVWLQSHKASFFYVLIPLRPLPFLPLLLQFAEKNRLTLICRAHQLVMDGYKFAFEQEPILVTIWSAPNYSYISGNSAAIMQLFPHGERHFIRFAEVPDSERSVPPRMPVPYFM